MGKRATEEEKVAARALSAATCTVCRKTKDRTAFRADKKKTNGLLSICISCRAADQKRRYDRDRAKILQKKRDKRNADLVAAHDREAVHRSNIRDAVNAKRRQRGPEARQQAVRKTLAWKAANPEKARQTNSRQGKQWRSRNPEKYKQQAANAWRIRRARKIAALVDRSTLEDIIARDGLACYICFENTDPDARPHTSKKTELEHVVPLSRGGLHAAENLRIACFRCNRLKSDNKTPEETRDLVRGLYVAATRPSLAMICA